MWAGYKSSARITVCCAILAAILVSGLSADTRQSSYQLPPSAQVIGYLLQSVNWYRHVYVERQVASDAADLLFLDNNQAIEAQIVKLSFDFAKADAVLATTADSGHNTPAKASPANPASSELARLIQVQNRSDQLSQQLTQDIAAYNEQIRAARKADQKKLQTALDDAQSRLELLHALSQNVNGLVEFLQSVGTSQAHIGNLAATIDDLAQSLPELNNPTAPAPKSPAQDASSKTTDRSRDGGLLGLASEVSALKRKLRVVDEKISITDDLALSVKNLRDPMTGFINQVLQSAGISDLQTNDLSSLRQQKSQLDALTVQLKALSPAIIALDEQKALLAEYSSHLQPWRTAVAGQYSQAWKKLVISVLVVMLIIGLLFGIGEVSRRLALRHIHDPNRRRVISVVNRAATLFAIVIVALFGLASDLSSLATYFGLLSAGVAVALQNVILAVLGYVLLMGKHGFRIGDRVQVSGVAGEVISLGPLQFQLREFDVKKQQFTGHVATFSNSLVFLSPATGLLKFNPTAEDAAKTEVNSTNPDLEGKPAATGTPS